MPQATLLHVYPTFAVGGAQARFCAVANHFGRRWRHLIVALDGERGARERLSPDLDVAFPDIVLPKRNTLGNLWRIRGALLALAPDRLVTSNWGSIEWAMAARLAKVAHIHVEDGFGPEERSRQLPRRVWTRRLALRRRHVILPSRVLHDIATRTWRLDATFVHYVPNGIDLARFAPVPEAARAPHAPPVIVAVAALRAEKNLARLIRAFAALQADSARMVLVGDGPERASLQALAATLGCAERIVFAGHDPAPAAALRRCDLFALTSDTEQMPLSILEAMAAGLPVVATDVGDVGVMLAAENRAYVSARDDAAFAEILRVAIADRDAWPAIGAANRARVETAFDQDTMFRRWAEAFDGAGPFAA